MQVATMCIYTLENWGGGGRPLAPPPFSITAVASQCHNVALCGQHGLDVHTIVITRPIHSVHYTHTLASR